MCTAATGPLRTVGLCKIPVLSVSPDRDRVPALKARRHAPSMQQPRQTIVAFNAARLGIESVLLVALLREFLFESPWPRPHGRILDGDARGEGHLTGAGPALNQVQVLARSKDIGFRTEVGHVAVTSVSPSQWPRESPNHCGRWPANGLPSMTMFRCTPAPDPRRRRSRCARGLHDPAETAGVPPNTAGRRSGSAPPTNCLRTIVAIHTPVL